VSGVLCRVHLFLRLVYAVSNASSVRAAQEGNRTISFSDFLVLGLMNEMFSFLSDCMPVGDQRYIEKHVPVEN
jgi:hypothetical protein